MCFPAKPYIPLFYVVVCLGYSVLTNEVLPLVRVRCFRQSYPLALDHMCVCFCDSLLMCCACCVVFQLGPLAQLQSGLDDRAVGVTVGVSVLPSSEAGAGAGGHGQHVQALVTLAHCEQRLLVARLIDSVPDVLHWCVPVF